MLSKLKNIFLGNELFKRFLLSYLCILLIPCILSMLVYKKANLTIKEDSIEAKYYMLSSACKSIDGYLSNIDSDSVGLGFENKVTRLLHYDRPESGSADIYWYYELLQEIKSNVLVKRLLEGNLYLIYPRSDTVFSNKELIFGIEKYYREYLSFEGMDYENWYDTFLKKAYFREFLPECNVLIEGKEKKVIPYLISLPFGYNKGYTALLMCLIDQEEIYRVLDSVNMNEQGFTCIIDQQGQVIVSSGENIDLDKIEEFSMKHEGNYWISKIDGEEILYVEIKSKINDWRYITVTPMSEIMKNVDQIRNTIIWVLAATFIVGMACALVFTYWNQKPFSKLIRVLKESLGDEREAGTYEFLEGSISDLIKNNKAMHIAISRQVEMLRTVFWDKVFKGEFIDIKELEVMMSHVGLNYSMENYIVLVTKLNQSDVQINPSILGELDIYRIAVEKGIEEINKGVYQIHMINENELAILIGFYSMEREERESILRAIVSQITKNILDYFHIKPDIGIGSLCRNLQGVSYSLDEAQQALNMGPNMLSEEENIFWYDQLKDRLSVYFYPANIEEKLINYIRTGNKNNVETVLKRIYDENCNKRTLSRKMKALLIHEMQGTVVKLIGQLDEPIDKDRYSIILADKQDIDHFFQVAQALYEDLCDIFLNTKKKRSDKIKNEILDYITEKYSSNQLCISIVAEAFGFSESYFSQLFKELVGTNFSTYVERVRIEEACYLIGEQKISIDEISRMTGYNNTHSFRRAFKKVIGVVPSEYREQNNVL